MKTKQELFERAKDIALFGMEHADRAFADSDTNTVLFWSKALADAGLQANATRNVELELSALRGFIEASSPGLAAAMLAQSLAEIASRQRVKRADKNRG